MAVGGAVITHVDKPDIPRVTWYREPGLRLLYFLLIVPLLSSATTGYDGSMMNSLQALDSWQNYFNHPVGATLGLLNAIYPVGSMVSMPIFPFIADVFGRRWGIIVASIIILIATALQGASQNVGMFIGARFLIGFGVQIGQGNAPLLMTELAHPQHRAIITSLYNTTWFVGNIIAVWATYGTGQITNTWAWRIPSILQGIFSFVQLLGILFLPESPRWLVQKNKSQTALRTLARYYSNGDEDDVTVQFVYREIETTIALEKEYSNTSYLELFRTKGNRHRSLIAIAAGFFSQWSGNGILSYYINIVLEDIGITDQKTKLVINGCNGIWGWIVAVSCCFLVDRAGRRKLFLVATAGMAITYTCVTIITARYQATHSSAAKNATLAFWFLYSFTYSIAWSGLLVSYIVEIFPYHIRAKGLALMFFCVNLSLFFNQYVNPVALSRITPWKYYAVYCGWILVELVVVYLFFPETRGPTLEEMARIFDGDDAQIGNVSISDIREHKIGIQEEEHVVAQIKV